VFRSALDLVESYTSVLAVDSIFAEPFATSHYYASS
jgi:hypothetical protein